MVKKKSGMGCRRKKSNSTNKGAKRSKTEEEKNPAQYRDGLLQGIRALLGKMDEKDLLAVMVYVGSMDGGAAVEKQKTTTSAKASAAPVCSVTATAREESIAITTVTVHPSSPSPTTTTEAPANPTTTEAVNPTTQANHPPTSASTTTTVPPSPQEQQVIELSKKTRPFPDNIVTIDPRCFFIVMVEVN